MNLIRATVALLAVLMLGGGAALAQDGSPSPGLTEAEATEQSVAESPAPDAMPVDQVEIGGVEYAFVGVPADVPTGTAFRLRNDGQELHEFAVVRRHEGTEQSVEELLAMGDEAFTLVSFVGTIFAEPGTVSADTLTVSEPGQYIAVCLVPQGTTTLPTSLGGPEPAGADMTAAPDPAASPADVQAEPDAGEPDVSASPGAGFGDGPPHAELGMVAEFSVGQGEGSAVDPASSPAAGMSATPEPSPAA